jgi:hypothetical protein
LGLQAQTGVQPDGNQTAGQHWARNCVSASAVAEATRADRAEQSSWSDDNEEQLVREKEKDRAEAEVWH